MDKCLEDQLAGSHGLITREQALDAGITGGEIQRRRRCGEWVLVRRGVYTTAENWDRLDPYRGQPLLRARAAVLKMRRGWRLSHDSAAHAFELDLPPIVDAHVHVTRPGDTTAWTEFGVKHHLARFDPEQVVVVGDLPCLNLARTAVDLAREHPEGVGLAACDGALRRGVSRQELRRAVDPMTNWPHMARVRRCLDRADGGAQTVLESLGRHFVWELNIGAPETQFPINTAKGVRWVDLRVGNHVFEIHGAQKYQPVSLGGLAIKPAHVVLLEERKRERWVTDRGLVVTNLYYEDVAGSRLHEARARALADHGESIRRFGTELPDHLAREAADLRRRFGLGPAGRGAHLA